MNRWDCNESEWCDDSEVTDEAPNETSTSKISRKFS